MKYFNLVILLFALTVIFSCDDEPIPPSCENDYAQFLSNDTLVTTSQMDNGSDVINPDGLSCGVAAVFDEANNFVIINIESDVHKIYIRTRVLDLDDNFIASTFNTDYVNSDLYSDLNCDFNITNYASTFINHPTATLMIKVNTSERSIVGEFNFDIETIFCPELDNIRITNGKFNCSY